MNWLQQHFNKFCDAGGDPVEFIIYNDISDDVAAELRAGYVRYSDCISEVNAITDCIKKNRFHITETPAVVGWKDKLP